MLWRNILRHQNPYAKKVPGVTDFALNEVVVIKTFHRNLGVGGGNDQVYRVTQKIGTGQEYNLAYYSYDHQGRVKVKQFTAGHVEQDYNIRGWLNYINVENPSNANENLEPHIFEETIRYDKGFASKYYNGNIAGITWRKSGEQAYESYGYTYDNLNRLEHAEYRRYDQPFGGWQKNDYDFTASNITYDLNGNLQSMDQEAPDIFNGSPIHMDQLTYSYEPSGNKLIKVSDGGDNVTTVAQHLPDFKDGADVPVEYGYDPNGNMISDQNKHISSIDYSYLNKPDIITVTGEGTITYVCDASGNRLQKKVLNTNTSVVEVYDYIGNFVYKDSVLQYLLNEEGRSRPLAVAIAGQSGNFTTKFVYDYFIKDHLSNIRSTVTAEPVDGVYLARHEIASAGIEQLFFDNIPNVRVSKPGSMSVDDGMAAKLNASDSKTRVGTAIMLQTMPGDRFNVSVDAYYNGAATFDQGVGAEDVINSLMSALTGGANFEGIPLSELPDNVRTVTGALNNPQLASQLNDMFSVSDNPDAPKAHLNYLFFNDKMELQPGNSGAVQVPLNPMGWFTMVPGLSGTAAAGSGLLTTEVPGWVIIYIDNQSIGDVWFDNLSVGMYKGVVAEENHYYPFGLTLQTAEAPNVTKNPLKLTTKELESNFGLNVYDFGARMQDMQLGRWWSIDPLSEKFRNSGTYNYAGNNPVYFIDIGGALQYPANKAKAYSDRYPMLTAYLQNNIQTDVMKSKIILNAMSKYSEGNLTPGQIKKDFKWGEKTSPTIVFDNNMKTNDDATAADFGKYSPSTNTITLNAKWADKMEHILTHGSLEEQQAALFEFNGTSTHEYVHRGDYLDGFRQTDMDASGWGSEPGIKYTEDVFESMTIGSPPRIPIGLSIHGDALRLMRIQIKDGRGELVPTVPKIPLIK